MRDHIRTGWRLLTRSAGQPPEPTRRNLLFDVALAVVLGTAMVQYARTEISSDDSAVLLIGAVIAAAALVVRRRYPLAVLWVVIAATLVASADQPRLTFYACVIAAYSAAAYSPYRIPTLATVGVAVLIFSTAVDSVLPVAPTQYIPLVVMVPIAVAADGLRRWKLRADERRTELADLERRQAEALRRAAEEERARIARELHDVVTHNVAVMIIQAGAARKVMLTSPAEASEALLAVESGGRAAMVELRQAMGLLTTDGDGRDEGDAAELEPQPGVSSLPSLVSRVRDAGLDVDLTITGAERPLPRGIELAAYRVVQEALTNSVKHAVGASASVDVVYGERELRVEVVDTGGTAGESASSGNMRGLIGLRERVAVYNGTVEAARLPTGGYRVTASIPVEDS
ncbi:sensor histidine kinase [Jiangella alkaliphila]|uniref:sensor histidine kinase n=1 Tax=Jiangella alkaliphila TaxID=419479 RepID=UPI0018D3B9A1|nr:histidine kinase [Jiangella alkaliphila]